MIPKKVAPVRLSGVVLLSLTLSSCSSSAGDSGMPPPPTRAQSAQGEMVALSNEAYAEGRTIPEPIDDVWPRLQVAYDLLGIPVTLSDSDRYRLGNPQLRPRRIGGERLSRYVDCGQGVTAQQNADTYSVTMYVVTTLSPAESTGHTRVETLVQASGKARATSSRPIPCASKGRLENLIAEMIGKG